MRKRCPLYPDIGWSQSHVRQAPTLGIWGRVKLPVEVTAYRVSAAVASNASLFVQCQHKRATASSAVA